MYKRSWLLFALVLTPFFLVGEADLRSESKARIEPHRSPIDVAVLPGGKQALTANHTSDSASLIDLNDGKLLAEVACERKPSAVACSRDGRRAAISNLWSGSVTLLEIDAGKLKAIGTAAVGDQPRGLAFAPNGETLYVALAGAGEVALLDWKTRKVQSHWPAPTEPRRLSLSPNGQMLAVTCARSGEVRCFDTTTGKQLWEQKIHDAFNLHGLTFAPDGKDVISAYVHHRHNPITKRLISEGWALNSRLAHCNATPKQYEEPKQIGLDIRGKAVGDPSAVAFSARGEWMVVTAGGTQEILLFRAETVPWMSGDAGDFLDSLLQIDEKKYRRLALGGRPLAVQFADDDLAVVANYLLDSVQVVDVKAGKVVRQIALGGPEKPSIERQGEAIFYDARRSHHQWFSCHTCHADGHTNGRAYDTLNDDSYGNPKMTPTLRGVARTGPYTWHGWQDKLDDAVEKSLTDTLFGPKPTAEEVKAVVAFLATLDHPPNPHRQPDGSLTKAAERGKELFNGKARCSRCHHGDDYTSKTNRDVKLEPDGSPFELWNPPSLRGVYDRGPYLHDGRAESLDELLRLPHSAEKLGGENLTAVERKDLIEFLKSL